MAACALLGRADEFQSHGRPEDARGAPVTRRHPHCLRGLQCGCLAARLRPLGNSSCTGRGSGDSRATDAAMPGAAAASAAASRFMKTDCAADEIRSVAVAIA